MVADYSILTSVESDLVKEFLIEETRVRAERRRDPLSLSLTNSMAFPSPRVLVPHKVQNFMHTTLNTAISTSDNLNLSVVLDNLAVFPVNIKKNAVLRIDSEYFVVLSEPVVTASTITCTCSRGTTTQLSSTAATHSAAATVYIEPGLTSETESYDRSDHLQGSRREAFTEVVQPFEFQQSRTAKGLSGHTVGGDNSETDQLARGLDIMLNRLQVLMFRRKKSSSSTITNSTTNVPDNRTASGITYWQDTYNGIVNNASGNEITSDMLDSDIETILRRGGGSNPETQAALGTGSTLICVVNETQKTKINRFLNNRIRTDQAQSTLTNFVGTYEAQARVDFVTAPLDAVEPDEYFIYDPKDVIVAPFVEGAFEEKDVAPDSGLIASKKQIVGEYGVVMYNPELSSRRHTLATT